MSVPLSNTGVVTSILPTLLKLSSFWYCSSASSVPVIMVMSLGFRDSFSVRCFVISSAVAMYWANM